MFCMFCIFDVFDITIKNSVILKTNGISITDQETKEKMGKSKKTQFL